MPAEKLSLVDFEQVEEIGAVSFLKNVGKGIAETIKKSLAPLHLVTDRVPAFNLLRKLYNKQSHVAEAARKLFYNQFQDGQKWYKYSKTAFIVGEMGTGKCIMGCYVSNGIMHLTVESNGETQIVKCDKPVNIALLGPTTLCEKWEREIKQTIPKAKVINCNGRDSLQKFAQITRNTYTDGPTFYILGQTRNYRHVSWEPFAIENKRQYVACPRCGTTLWFKVPKEADKRPVSMAEFLAFNKKHKCSECHNPLWKPKGIQEVSPSYYAAKKLKRLAKQSKLPMIDLAIVDEAHEIKGDGPQGWLAGCLLQSAKRRLLLTGTLTGGYAENLWFLFWRTIPSAMVREGFKYGKIMPWNREYGAIEEKVEVVVDKKSGEEKLRFKPRMVAGISARIYTRFLMNRAIFLQMAELGLELPAYKEHEVGIDMDPELEDAYLKYDHAFRRVLERLADPAVRKKDAVTLSHSGIHRLMQFLDSLKSSKISGTFIKTNEDGEETTEEFDIPMAEIDLPSTAKERMAVDIALTSRANGRKTLFFVNYTRERDCIGRLSAVLAQAGLNVGVLRDKTVKAAERERWIKDHPEFDCLICHPDLVRTGLDLIEYPDVVFYQHTYNIYTLRQAARRSWRIGQTKPVHIYFLYYRRSIQHTAMQVIASKLDSALLAEGVVNDSDVFKLSASRDGVLRDMAKAMLKGDIEEFSLREHKTVNLDELLAMSVADFAKNGAMEEESVGTEAPEEVIVSKINKVLAHLVRKEGRKKVSYVAEAPLEEVPTGTQLCLF